MYCIYCNLQSSNPVYLDWLGTKMGFSSTFVSTLTSQLATIYTSRTIYWQKSSYERSWIQWPYGNTTRTVSSIYPTAPPGYPKTHLPVSASHSTTTLISAVLHHYYTYALPISARTNAMNFGILITMLQWCYRATPTLSSTVVEERWLS